MNVDSAGSLEEIDADSSSSERESTPMDIQS